MGGVILMWGPVPTACSGVKDTVGWFVGSSESMNGIGICIAGPEEGCALTVIMRKD